MIGPQPGGGRSVDQAAQSQKSDSGEVCARQEAAHAPPQTRLVAPQAGVNPFTLIGSQSGLDFDHAARLCVLLEALCFARARAEIFKPVSSQTSVVPAMSFVADHYLFVRLYVWTWRNVFGGCLDRWCCHPLRHKLILPPMWLNINRRPRQVCPSS